MTSDDGGATGRERPRRRVREQTLDCGWCGTSFTINNSGRTPKWCSPRCRRRAWEQRRAAESGLTAIDVVIQKVEVEPPLPRNGGEAVRAINHITDRVLDDAYSRADLRRITDALSHLIAAFEPTPAPPKMATLPDHVNALNATAARVRCGMFPALQLPEIKTATYALSAAIDDRAHYEHKREQNRAAQRVYAQRRVELAEQMRDPVFVTNLRQVQADLRSAAFREARFRAMKANLDPDSPDDEDEDFFDCHPESYT